MGASVKLQTEDQMLREETSDSAGAVAFSSATVPGLEALVAAGVRLQLAIHDRAQELRTTTVGVEFPADGTSQNSPNDTESVKYMVSTPLTVGVEVSLLAQDYTVLGFEVEVDSAYCPPKYVDVRSDSSGYIARNALARGCSFSLRSFDEWRELVEGDVVRATLHAPGYQNTTAELRLGPLFEKEAYVFRMRFEPLEPGNGNGAKGAKIAAGVLGALLGIVVVALVVFSFRAAWCGGGNDGMRRKCGKHGLLSCSCCCKHKGRSLRVPGSPRGRTIQMQALTIQPARRKTPREDSDSL